MRRNLKIWFAAAGVFVFTTASVASADEAPQKSSKPSASPPATVMKIVDIKGRLPRPMVMTDVSKVSMERPLGELRQPFLAKVETVIERAPF